MWMPLIIPMGGLYYLRHCPASYAYPRQGYAYLLVDHRLVV